MGNPEENRNRTGKGTGEIPDLKLTARTDRFIGKYGRMREIYLREHEPVFYSRLVLDEKIYPYLIETEQKVQERMDHILPELMEEAGIQEGGSTVIRRTGLNGWRNFGELRKSRR